MNWVKGLALVTCLGAPLSVITAANAQAPASTPAPAASSGGTMMKSSGMSDADKRAKAADCSRQADAKKLHGEARRKFREECKKK